jgi:hypothetical protein
MDKYQISFMTKEGNFGRMTQPAEKVGKTVDHMLRLGDTVTKIEKER